MLNVPSCCALAGTAIAVPVGATLPTGTTENPMRGIGALPCTTMRPETSFGAGMRITRFVMSAVPTVTVVGEETEFAATATAVYEPGRTSDREKEPSASTAAVMVLVTALPVSVTLVAGGVVGLLAVTRPLTLTHGGGDDTPRVITSSSESPAAIFSGWPRMFAVPCVAVLMLYPFGRPLDDMRYW